MADALLRERGAGPDAARLSAARPDAQPDRGRRTARACARTRSTRQPRRVGRASQVSRPGRRRPAPRDLARAVQQPAVPRTCCPPFAEASRASSSSTRRTASPTGVTTSAPTTGASRDMLDVLPRRRPRAVHDGDRERPRRRRRDRATGASATGRGTVVCTPTAARSPAKSLRLEVVDLPAPGRPTRLARAVPAELPGSGIIYTLTKATPRRSRGLASPSVGSRGASIRARPRPSERKRSRSGCSAQRAEGRRRHVGARHGLRQARSRLRGALPGAGSVRSPTTSRSAVPAAASTTRTPCCCAAPRIAASRTSSSSRRSRPAETWSVIDCLRGADHPVTLAELGPR